MWTASRTWWRQAAAMLVCPVIFRIPMTALRRVRHHLDPHIGDTL